MGATRGSLDEACLDEGLDLVETTGAQVVPTHVLVVTLQSGRVVDDNVQMQETS